jgi:hypothetical protein
VVRVWGGEGWVGGEGRSGEGGLVEEEEEDSNPPHLGSESALVAR